MSYRALFCLASLCVVAGLLCGSVSACMMQQTFQPTATSPAPKLDKQAPNMGACAEISVARYQRGDLGRFEPINEEKARNIVVLNNIVGGSEITISGDDSCLYITGDVGPGTAIRVNGNGSAIAIDGAIDHLVVLSAFGQDATMWLPTFVADSDAPYISVRGDTGGAVWIEGGKQLET